MRSSRARYFCWRYFPRNDQLFVMVAKKINESQEEMNTITYLGDAKRSDVLAVGGGAVTSSPQRRHDAADAFHSDASVDGVSRRGRGTRQPGTSVVVADRFHGRRQDARHHTQHWGHAHCGHTPLTCGHRGQSWVSRHSFILWDDPYFGWELQQIPGGLKDKDVLCS